ncbi:hypothetical protein CFP65_1826 [Kitasatospora sp. MMS16-BH015]|uniref:hypothetical protein n=1 Tax=Kitasatospora sp. MMS16-BH015 TaxID=2018025 RepID=UPI000CA30615|nr:hypothetical protein [Kitasatospora sp. MMS16-BH015]AUG76700.1 hypothetical protein CFP65_1826 [Kitasatospora sp. MMS16-BH015]
MERTRLALGGAALVLLGLCAAAVTAGEESAAGAVRGSAAVFGVAAPTGGAGAPGAAQAAAELKLSSPDGPPTAADYASFRAYLHGLTPAADNLGNNWAQGRSGEETQAMGVVYELSHDRAVLDKMIGHCDAVLSERDDLAPAPVGQHVLWTGTVDPAWPNEVTTRPIGTGGEQGDPIGHLASCARLILKTPALAGAPVTGGDPHHYGTTYLARARTYLSQADTSMDRHVLARLLDLSHGDRMYFAAADPYQGGRPVPWNQQMMFDYAFQNLAEAHEALADDPARVKTYDRLVKTSVDWFFGTVRRYTDAKGRPAYDWTYAPLGTDREDNSHGSLDCDGLYRAYLSGRYGITPAMLTPLADTFADVMTKSAGHYAGKVDGTDGAGNSAPTTYVRSGWLQTAEFRPDVYHAWAAVDFPGGTSTAVDRYSRELLLKSRRK